MTSGHNTTCWFISVDQYCIKFIWAVCVKHFHITRSRECVYLCKHVCVVGWVGALWRCVYMCCHWQLPSSTCKIPSVLSTGVTTHKQDTHIHELTHKHPNNLFTTMSRLNIAPSWTIKHIKKETRDLSVPHVLIWQSLYETDWQQMWNTISIVIHPHVHTHTHTHTHYPIHTRSAWVGLLLEQTHSVKQSSVDCIWSTSCCRFAGQTQGGHFGTILRSFCE